VNQITIAARLLEYAVAMPTPVPRSSRIPSPSRPIRPALRTPAGPTRLTVLVAGVEKDERPPIEAAVRRALADRDPTEPWAVSLVRLGATWSVTLSGPGQRFRSLSFTTEKHRLAEAIREAVSDEGTSPSGASEPQAWPAGEPIQERFACARCQKPILVTYEGQPDEPKQAAPLACPHCWTINHVEIGAWAAAGGDYRAEKG
jgi:hypothetical protein